MTQNPNDTVNIPEGDVIDDAAPARRKSGLPPVVKFGLLVSGAMLVIGGGVFYTAKQQVAPSVAPRAASLDATPGGVIQRDSELYQDSVRTMNENRAQRAGELGITSVPTPEVIMQPVEEPMEIREVAIPDEAAKVQEAAPAEQAKPVERRLLPKPQPAPKRVEQAQPAAQSGSVSENGGEKEENPYIARIGSQMASMAPALMPKQMSSATVTTAEKEDGVSGSGMNGSADAGSGGEPAPAILIRPGDVIYAETLTSVNSDSPSPVMVEITSGDFKGARLVGEFTAEKTAGRMVVAFSNMTLEDGTVMAVNAFAVDGRSAETAVASDVERRYVARYAPIVASTFISGFAESAAQPSTTVVGSGDNATVSIDAATAEQSLLAGVAAASTAVASDIMTYAPKGPKIILRDGYPLGILFVDPVYESRS
ncbi:DotG/IcmE/VirB10 family protein [Defluviimonas salinarum]|uniref:Type IV secretion system protein VirB10 n=1 Tax=Defluviimonas salinarum TaxID=2992147 RepID=A0ABT3J4K0_9RHOB|nr:DotG/IcmE/VirB10 family protein [Defluviimonas salinarum]MCW3782614.1 hypothetical protein [Defluviimonas salinarum]